MAQLRNTSGIVLYSDDSPTLLDTLNAAIRDAVELPYLDLSYADLSGARIRGLVAPNVQIQNAKLIGTSLTDAILPSAYLLHVDLSRAYLSSSFLPNAQLYYCTLRHTSLVESCLADVLFHGCHLEHAQLSHSTTAGLTLRQCTVHLDDAPPLDQPLHIQNSLVLHLPSPSELSEAVSLEDVSIHLPVPRVLADRRHALLSAYRSVVDS